jgi:hypothetical protein
MKNCCICNKPTLRSAIFYNESEKYIICIECNFLVKTEIIGPKLKEFIVEFVSEEFDEEFDSYIQKKNKRCHFILNKILLKSYKKESFVSTFNNYITPFYKKMGHFYKNDLKNNN